MSTIGLAAALAAVLLAGTAAGSMAQSGPPGITAPRAFAPFDANAPRCTPPAGLEKVLAFAQDNRREFMQGVHHGLELAARKRGLEYRQLLADSDDARQLEQVRGLAAAKVGGVVASPVNAAALAQGLQQVIWTGGYVGTVVPPPATSLLNAPQYLTGRRSVTPRLRTSRAGSAARPMSRC